MQWYSRWLNMGMIFFFLLFQALFIDREGVIRDGLLGVLDKLDKLDKLDELGCVGWVVGASDKSD